MKDKDKIIVKNQYEEIPKNSDISILAFIEFKRCSDISSKGWKTKKKKE